MNEWVGPITCSRIFGLTFILFSDGNCLNFSSSIRLPSLGITYTDSPPSALFGRTFSSSISDSGGCPRIPSLAIRRFTCPAPGGGGESGGDTPIYPEDFSPSWPSWVVGIIIVGVLLLLFGGCGVFAYYRWVEFQKPHNPNMPNTAQRVSDWGAATRTHGGSGGVQEIPTLNPLSSLPVGSVVTLTGLMGVRELNGAQARVVGGFDVSIGRVSVALLNDPSRVISVKPDCLEKTLLPPSSIQPPAQPVYTSPDGRRFTYNVATGESIWLPSTSTLPRDQSIVQ